MALERVMTRPEEKIGGSGVEVTQRILEGRALNASSVAKVEDKRIRLGFDLMSRSPIMRMLDLSG